jgi:hypothetical protein
LYPYRWSSFNVRSSIVLSLNTIFQEYYCLIILITSLRFWTSHSSVYFHSFGFKGRASAKVRFGAFYCWLYGFTVL